MEDRKHIEDRKLKIFELIVSIFFILFCSVMLYVSFTTKVSMGAYSRKELASFWFPKIVLFLMLGFAICCLIFTVSWFVRHKNEEKNKISFFELFHKKSVITYILLLVYVLMWNVIGFALSTFLYFGVQTKVMDVERSWKQIMLVSAGLTALLVLVFSVAFSVDFPEPLFELIFS